MFFLLYRQTDYSVFDDFQKISDYLPKISEDSKVTQSYGTFSETF